MFQLDLERADKPEIKLPTSSEKARAFQKNIYFCFIDYFKAFDCVDHNKLWKILRDRRTRDQLANIHWIIKKAREFQKNIYFCFTHSTKAFDCVDHNKLWKILEEIEVPDHLCCLLRNLYVGQEATVRTGDGTTDWFKIGKGVCQGFYHHPVYLTYMQRHHAKCQVG